MRNHIIEVFGSYVKLNFQEVSTLEQEREYLEGLVVTGSGNDITEFVNTIKRPAGLCLRYVTAIAPEQYSAHFFELGAAWLKSQLQFSK